MTGENRAVFDRIYKFAAQVERMPFEAMTATAGAVKAAHEVAVAAVAGGDRILSGMQGRPTPLTASTVIASKPGESSILVSPKPAGQWGLLEKGAKSHLIGTKSRGSRGRLRKSFAARDTALLSTEDTGFLYNAETRFRAMAPVFHPGSPKRPTWEKGRKAGRQASDLAVKVAHRKAVVKVFGRV